MTDNDDSADAGSTDVEKENWIARNSKTISTLATVAIPVVLAIVGTIANTNINKQNLDKEYVALAYKILGDNPDAPDGEDSDSAESAGPTEGQTCQTDLDGQFRPEPGARVDQSAVQSILGKLDLETVGPRVALRSYALELLIETTPVTLSERQYVALLCGAVTLPNIEDPILDPPTGAADAGSVDDALAQAVEGDDQRETAAVALREAFLGLEDSEAPLTECVVELTDLAESLDGKRLEPGTYETVVARVGDTLRFVQVAVADAEPQWLALGEQVVLNVECDIG
jgi:hypothetical protein